MASQPTVTVIVVSWNSEAFIQACVRSIPAALGPLAGEIILVDNASSDGTIAQVRRLAAEISGLTSMLLPQNEGFAQANNRGLRLGRGDYFLLLNPDTQLAAGAIAAMVDCAIQQRAAIVGARHRHPDGRLQPSVRRLPTVLALLLIMLKAHRVLPWLPPLVRYTARDFDSGKTQSAEQVAGSCLLISRSAYQRLGPLDERFHLWFEEVDWCRRARDAGLPVWYCAEAEVTHDGAHSFKQVGSLVRQRAFNRSLYCYVRKHHGMLAAALVLALYPASLALAALADGLPARQALPR